MKQIAVIPPKNIWNVLYRIYIILTAGLMALGGAGLAFASTPKQLIGVIPMIIGICIIYFLKKATLLNFILSLISFLVSMIFIGIVGT